MKTTSGSVTDYCGNFIYADNQLITIFAGDVRIAPVNFGNSTYWKYEYSMKNHLGNTRVIFAAHSYGQPELLQQTSYYPFGMTIQQQNFYSQNTTENKYLYNSKELQDDQLAGNTLDWYDYGARFYDAALGRWHVVDPMAHVAPDWSPFRAFYCNPIGYIDPTGMLEDDYGLDKQGNITLLRKTDDPTDKLIALDNDGNETDKSIEVDKGILSSKKTNTVNASNGNDYTFDQYKIKRDDKAKGLFEFVADNTEVEWSLTGVGAKSGTDGQNILTTSHIKDAEIGGGYLKAYGYTIRKHSHSHPYNKFPSAADKKFAESLNLKFPKATLDIYHKGEYFQYAKNGLISVPTIVLPEIEIKVPKN